MSYTIAEIKDHLIGMGHGASLAKVRNEYAMYERAANNMRSAVDVITAIRTAPLTQAVHDDVYNYAAASDYGKIIDLYPSGVRGSRDFSRRTDSVAFDLLKSIQSKQISVESEDGARFLRVNWPKTAAKTLAAMNSITNWTADGGASGLSLDTLYAISGGKSLKMDLGATGGALSNSSLDSLDLSDWDEEAEFFMYVYLPSVSTVTSIQGLWGNDLTTNYWTSVAQTTQADGTAFKVGWNLIKFSWSAATESGTVDPTAIDSFKVTVVTTDAIADVRFDNVTVSLGHIFDMKYYSAFLFKNSAGTWIRRPTVDTDSVMVDELGMNIYAYECLKAMSQQTEGEDSSFDISFALEALNGNRGSADPAMRMGLYANYRKEYPTQTKKQVTTYFSF